MGPDAAVHALFGGQIADMDGDAKDAFIESAKGEFDRYIDIEKQASKMQVDELIPAGDLREHLEVRLDTYRTKGRDDRPRHHGTVFF